MNWFVALILGLIIGWLAELVIDFVYWRKRRLAPDDDARHLQEEVKRIEEEKQQLQLALDGNRSRLQELEAAQQAEEARFQGLLADLETSNGRIAQLDQELTTCATDLEATNQKLATVEATLISTQQRLADCEAAKTEPAPTYRGPSGLSMIWGLNTAANQRLEEKGVENYNQLTQTTASEMEEVLALAAPYYPDMEPDSIHTTWVEQANIAAMGDWDGLHDYQQRSKLIALREDLKKLWGVGPKIEEVLNENGIYLYAQIASVPADRITEILRRAGSRFRMSSSQLHETWPEQARLADRGEWDALQTFQDTLSWDKVND